MTIICSYRTEIPLFTAIAMCAHKLYCFENFRFRLNEFFFTFSLSFSAHFFALIASLLFHSLFLSLFFIFRSRVSTGFQLGYRSFSQWFSLLFVAFSQFHERWYPERAMCVCVCVQLRSKCPTDQVMCLSKNIGKKYLRKKNISTNRAMRGKKEQNHSPIHFLNKRNVRNGEKCCSK